MSTWGRRLVYLLLLILWLIVMSFPIGAAVLATSGQLELGNEQSANHLRLFLVQERSQEGVGLEWTRRAALEGCRQGRLFYLMWEGSGENATYCTCYDATGSVVRSEPGSCSGNEQR